MSIENASPAAADHRLAVLAAEPSPKFLKNWANYQLKHEGRSIEENQAELPATEVAQ